MHALIFFFLLLFHKTDLANFSGLAAISIPALVWYKYSSFILPFHKKKILIFRYTPKIVPKIIYIVAGCCSSLLLLVRRCVAYCSAVLLTNPEFIFQDPFPLHTQPLKTHNYIDTYPLAKTSSHKCTNRP